jgi:CubicO group peptidase (beta-lactamase class C family)
MIRNALAAATLLLAAAPAIAQSQQEALDARYTRSLAAGYKALMLCGAIASAEASGARERSEASVLAYELTGIQQPQDAVVADLPYRIERWPDGAKPIRHVAVDWAEDMPPRIAFQRSGGGCSLAPVGMRAEDIAEGAPPPAPDTIALWHMKRPGPLARVLEGAMMGAYGAKARTTAVSVNWGEDGWDWRFAEGFTPYTPQRTWSVAKSLSATLVGAAVHRGEADVTASAGLGLSDGDPRRAITIDHLLRMASGRYSETPGNRTDPLYFGGASVAEVVLDWPLVAPPGSTFRYANNDTLAAVAAIKPTFAKHPPAELFATIGMDDTVAETDWQGDYILSSQVWASTMDLIRFGQLYLNDGKLANGTRILPEGWIKYVTTPSGPQPATGTFGYGAGFWLMNREEGVPPDAFSANGNRGQYVVIIPSKRIVIVRRGEDPPGGGFDIAAFTRDVLKALPGE